MSIKGSTTPKGKNVKKQKRADGHLRGERMESLDQIHFLNNHCERTSHFPGGQPPIKAIEGRQEPSRREMKSTSRGRHHQFVTSYHVGEKGIGCMGGVVILIWTWTFSPEGPSNTGLSPLRGSFQRKGSWIQGRETVSPGKERHLWWN